MTDQFAVLEDAFIRCDRDQDGRLNESEFLDFCAMGLRKPQTDNRMYVALCNKLETDPSLGVLWADINVMFASSNTQAQSPSQIDTQTEESVSSRNDLSSPVPHHHHRSSSVSSYTSQEDGMTRRSLLVHDRMPSSSLQDFEDDLSQTSDGPRLSMHHGRAQSSMAELELIKALEGSNQAQHKKMSKKIRRWEKKYASLEREKRHALDQVNELNSQVLILRDSVARLEREKAEATERGQQVETEREDARQQLRLIESEREGDRRTTENLEIQRNEVLLLFKNAEAQFESQMAGVRRKHKEQIEKISVQFVQSVGAQPGEDIRSMVQELREEKGSLNTQVGMLAEQLTRKDRSLFEALQALDILTTASQHRSHRESSPAPASPSRNRDSILRRRFSLKGIVVPSLVERYRRSNVATPETDEEVPLRREVSLPSALGMSGTISASQNNAHRPLPQEGTANRYQYLASSLVTQGIVTDTAVPGVRAT